MIRVSKNISYMLLASGILLFPVAGFSVSVEEDFSDMSIDIASFVGEKSVVIAEGADGDSSGAIKTTFDDNGHADYVIALDVPEEVQADTLYFSYDAKVDNASAYMIYGPKHLKFRSLQDNGCYWNTTIRWDTIMFGGGECERDVKYRLISGDTTGAAPWRIGSVEIPHPPEQQFAFVDGQWNNWKVMVTANTITAGVANADGEIKIWIDNELYWHVSKIEFRHSSMVGWKINTIDLGGYTSGNPGETAEITIDNIKISSEPGPSLPMPPGNLELTAE